MKPMKPIVLALSRCFALACVLVGAPAVKSAADAASALPQLREVIVVFKTHFDIGYTDLASNIVQRYRTTMIDEALEVVDRSRDLPADRQFVWTIPGWPASKILEDWPGQTDRRRERLRHAFKQGRFALHALPFTTHTELLDLEDIVRGLGYSARLARSLGLDLPRDAKMTDVPSHSWVLPTILRHAGVEFLHLGCNAASSSPDVPMLFWWEGPDGSRLLTMYTAESYGTGLVPPAGWPHRTWLALIHTGDNHGPPRPDEIGQLFAEADRKLPGVRVRIGRLADFADALQVEKPKLPVVRGDMPDTWIHGPLCDPVGAGVARRWRPAIAATESLATLLRVWNVRAPDPSTAIRAASEGSLLYGEHTWGGALYWVTKYGKDVDWHYGEVWRRERAAGRFRRLEDSWTEHSAYIHEAQGQIEPALADQLSALAANVEVRGKRIVVFNPLPWQRTGLVALDRAPAGMTSLRPADGGETVPLAMRDGQLRFVARDVPALGYRAYVPLPLEKKTSIPPTTAQTQILENTWFRVVLDPASGSMRSLVNKRSGRELVDSAAAPGFGQFLYERFDADQVARFVQAYVKIDADWGQVELGKPPLPSASEIGYRAATPRDCTLRLEGDSLSQTAVMTAQATDGLPCPVTTRVVLYRDLPWLDVEITLHQKPADPWPEAGWICLPIRTSDAQFRLGRLGGLVDPARDLVPGANHHVFGISTGVSVTGADGAGLVMCPLDSPLVSLDSPGLWQYSRQFIPKRPAVYVNLFNNQWSTNFRLWNEGSWTSRVRLWATDKGAPIGRELATKSWEARIPLQAAYADGRAGTLPRVRRGFEISRPGAMVTAFGPNVDGRGTVLRVWEQAGESGACSVRLPDGLDPLRAQPLDLRGRPTGDPVKVSHRRFTFELPANALATFAFD